jgi:hypothetical protein
MTFSVGEKLVWMRIDEQTGQHVNDFVRVMRVPKPDARTHGAREQYQVMVLRTNEPAIAWRDELYRFEE